MIVEVGESHFWFPKDTKVRDRRVNLRGESSLEVCCPDCVELAEESHYFRKFFADQSASNFEEELTGFGLGSGCAVADRDTGCCFRDHSTTLSASFRRHLNCHPRRETRTV